ncbi:antibiotic biosynthesis monooxygenase [Leptospira biflexa]|jgi:heme-degrading monooxygenase HmoA|uniref:antibiotic biosynthesis monooxygenase family protein n=1 Tax=Leptospira biflexa TaxID=172 RepID=UPI00108308C9|nr:antibiotic biosynthesis monooxygenase family protein [Leptospira biflexa]TGM37873.1 antibiotic biosynthesis monooxygenase [Leptospira biflexa]TGM41204.1 antibiotic biosynthesis monooxygenase [Leptospira biflexa]TGM47407.1 antibiotic biosynthesis monooxygenase [Leptospira biflexa]TGM50128.1 antibiotic biosynthesis monooxygenase [Leptospira biflexa]
MNQILIDRFQIPKEAKEVFLKRVKINREYIKTIPGFLGDEVFLCEKNNNILVVTVAKWKDKVSLQNAKALVFSEYQKQNFDMNHFLALNSIQIEREIFQNLET